MIKENILKSLNKQFNAELFASYQYLAMSAYFESQNLNGFANWMKVQSQEEYSHGMKFYSYILQVNGKVEFLKIDPPKGGWKSVQDVFEDTFNHEQAVTKSIYELVDLAIAEKDHATNNYLQWFISEQVEEEATALKILDKIKLIGDSKNGLFLLDHEMRQRTAAAT